MIILGVMLDVAYLIGLFFSNLEKAVGSILYIIRAEGMVLY